LIQLDQNLLMKNRLLFPFIFMAFRSLTQIWEMDLPEINPGKLKSYVHVCASEKDSAKALPLVVVLHGCTQNAEEIAHDSEWNVLAEKHQFHVLYPEQQRTNNLSMCYNWFNAKDRSKNKGEVMSIYQQIQQARKFLKIDTTKIFVYGVSAGAAMANNMLVCYPDLFKAGALLAGPPYGQTLNFDIGMNQEVVTIDLSPAQWEAIAREQNPTYIGNYPKVVIMHGTKDFVVPYHWGIELSEQWIALNDTGFLPIKTELNFNNSDGLTRASYTTSDSVERVIFYSHKNWGHSISIDPGEGNTQGGQKGSFAKDGNFYSTYWIAKDFDLIKEN
jgi:poly(hydroxyalkanoate) depolymerase family esterase